MDRRNFFKHCIGKVASVGSDYLDQKAEQKAKGWIRPPFAIAEFDLLLNCSRCGECIDACPHQVIFALPVYRGASVANTPAMDIPNNACQLCSDWHCVTACKDKALSFSVSRALLKDDIEIQQIDEIKPNIDKTVQTVDKESLEGVIDKPEVKDCPPMASAYMSETLCMPYSGPECGACKGSCPIPDTLIFINEKPIINLQNCIGCGLCIQSCISNPKAITIGSYQDPIEQEQA
ncbi:MAG: hypothetical protein GY951_09650 [Psychromonas sp.]|nr:hypothetical protein [Psychromonas sp.]